MLFSQTKQRRNTGVNYKKAYDYIEDLYAQSNLTKKQYSDDTELKNFAPVVDNDVARMLQVLIMMKRPQKILEIGTSIGFSTVIMAKSAKLYGGKIVTVEIDAEVAAQAVKNFERLELSEQIEVRVGDARTVMPDLNAEFDLIFQDVGNKYLYAEMLDDYVRLLKTGGVLLAEDTLYPADIDSESGNWAKMCVSLGDFNKKIAACPEFESTLLPIGDGLTVAVRR
jgi:predicted O-methyltransferase YrrM